VRRTLAALLTLAVTALTWAQTSSAPPAVIRKMLMQQDLSIPDYQVLLLTVEIPAGGREGKHKHSGDLAVYIQEGEMVLEVEGKPTMTYKAGDTFFVEAGTVHEGINRSGATGKGVATLITPKGQPVTIQTP